MRTLAFLLAASIVPLCAGAQTADAVATDLAADWAAQKARMVALAEAMPADKYDFKATPAQRSFGEQLHHLAQAHVRMLRMVDAAGKVPAPTIGEAHDRDSVVKAVTAAYDYGQKVIESAGALAEKAGERSRARAVWGAMLNAMNHYGQCVVYLRLNGIVPPASR
jgi:hypothetical protein